MATAGDRYDVRTGNIWSYAHRGDMTGLKAAILRGVDVNMVNTVGWTPCHAAAAGGQSKALRYLVTVCGADLEIADKSGDLVIHQAAKNGHDHVLRLMYRELGADIARVRLSQAKGKAVKDLVLEAYRTARDKNKQKSTAAGVQSADEDDEDDGNNNSVVGYARKQSKSTAFWGPRKTPSSCKIKKKILKERRQRKKARDQEQDPNKHAEKGTDDENADTTPEDLETKKDMEAEKDAATRKFTSPGNSEVHASCYAATVQQVKRSRKQKREARSKEQETPLNPHPRLETIDLLTRDGYGQVSTSDDEFNSVASSSSSNESSSGDEEEEGPNNPAILAGSRFAVFNLTEDSDSD